MRGRRSVVRSIWNAAAGVTALIISLAGPSFGQERSGTASPDSQGTNMVIGEPELGQDTPGRIENGSGLALKIERKQKIRVFTPQGRKDVRRPVILAGGLASRDTADGYDQSTFIAWKDIEGIQVRKGGAGGGALLGAAAGVVAGVGLVWLIDKNDGDIPGEGPSGKDYQRVALVFGTAGAVLGSVVGVVTMSWKTVYTAREGKGPSLRIALMPAHRGGMMICFSLAL